MKYLYISFVALLAMYLSSCDSLKDECSLTNKEITNESLITSSAYFTYCGTVSYRYPTMFELYYNTGSCTQAPRVKWELPEYTKGLSADKNEVIQPAFEFNRSGKIKAYLIGENGQVSDTAIQDVTVLRENIWGISYDNFPAATGTAVSNRTVALNLNNRVYAGFGRTNAWYEFDTISWTWIERAKIPNLVDFQAFAVSRYNDKAYLFGTNRNVYEYNPDIDEWTNYDTLPKSFYADLLLQNNASRDRDFQYPVVCRNINNTIYYGVGGSGNFYSYNVPTKTWTALEAYPAPYSKDKHVFVLNNKIYVGSYIFNTTTQKWEQNNIDFALPYSAPMEIGNKVYFGSAQKTYVYNGVQLDEYTEGVKNECYSIDPQSNFLSASVTIGNLCIFPHVSNHKMYYYSLK